jgi:putative oxidoreductase
MSNRLEGRVGMTTGGLRPVGAAEATRLAPHDNHQGRAASGTSRVTADDYGKLLLRVAVGGLMLFHGVHKVRYGVDWMFPLLEAKGLPALIAYGSYLGEVVAPILILAGVLTRLSSLTVAGTMVMAVFLALSSQVFALNQYGGWAIELNAFFFLAALALALLGGGKLSAWRGRAWWSQ